MTSEDQPLNHKTLTPFLEQEYAMNTKVTSSYDRIGNLVASLMGQKCVSRGQKRKLDIFWNERHFGLDKVSLFQDLSSEKKSTVLKLLTDHNLNESYYIEKLGMSYCAKMILMSESEEEKALYSTFACDEATHLYEVKNFLHENQQQTYRGNGFLKFIADVVQNESPKVCQAILQVGLEGHGIGYYHWLNNGCLDRDFQNVLRRIISDEASHHGSGVTIASQCDFAGRDLNALQTHIAQLTSFLNCTHLPTVAVLEQLVGGLTEPQRVQVFSELNVEEANGAKMTNLAHLLRISKLDQKVPSSISDQWSRGWNAQTCNQAYMQMLSAQS